ncbi:tudor domain-containing protein 5 [Aplochiton taeniatus]
MTQEQILAQLKKDVRSLLISAKTGLTPDQLQRDYAKMLGYPLPLRQLGFRNVLDMVQEIPDVVAVDYLSDGSLVLKAVGDETTRGIEELVAKQRKAKTNTKAPMRRGGLGSFLLRYPHHPVMVLPRRGHAPPALPVQLHAQLRQLLSLGPVFLSKFEVSFLRHFGQPLRVTNYGFYSIAEMLGAASDIVMVTQGRMGSVLSLRAPPFVMPARTTFSKAPSPSSPISMKTMVQPVKKKTVENQRPLNIQNPTGSQPKEATSSIGSIPGVQENLCPQKIPYSPTQDGQLFQKCVEKLEEELRQRILENGDAGTVNPELKAKLQQVVGQCKEGISIHNLPIEYKRIFGEELPVVQSGFLSVTDLVGALSDILYLRPVIGDEGHHDMMVTDIQHAANTESVSSGLSTSEPMCGGEGVNSASTGYYFSCEESPWEGKANDTSPVDDDLEEAAENCVTTFQPTTRMLPTVHVRLGSVVPPDALRGQCLKAPTLRRPRELVPVLVEHVESPSQFFVRFDEIQEARGLENMMIEMRSCYSCPEVSDRYRLPERYVRQGQVCCVSPRDVWFYRVIIHHIVSDTQVEVYYADFGDLAVMERAHLKFLKSCYSELPSQAVPSLLAGIKPIGGTWSTSATSAFKKLCCDRTLVAALHSYHAGFLQLFLCDTHSEEDVYIHGALQAQGHGLSCAPAVSSLLCSQFNPVSLYMGEGGLDLGMEVEEELEPCTEPPITLEHYKEMAIESPTIQVTNGSKGTGEMAQFDLPQLEFIEVTGVNTNGQGEERNPFTALLMKEPVVSCSDWDQGWVPETEPSYHGDGAESSPSPLSSPSQQPPTLGTQSLHPPSPSQQPPTLGTLSLHPPSPSQQPPTLGTLSLHPPSPSQQPPTLGTLSLHPPSPSQQPPTLGTQSLHPPSPSQQPPTLGTLSLHPPSPSQQPPTLGTLSLHPPSPSQQPPTLGTQSLHPPSPSQQPPTLGTQSLHPPSPSQQPPTLGTQSLHPPSLLQTQGSLYGVRGTPPLAPLLFPLWATKDVTPVHMCSRPASPLALGPAARLAANIHHLNWYPHTIE